MPRWVDIEKIQRKFADLDEDEIEPLDLWVAVMDAPYWDVEVAPVEHGRWEDRGGLLTPMHRYDEFTNPDSVFYGTCSVCGITVYQGGILNGFKYCPHCGAKMDLKPPEETEKGESPC